MISTLEKEITFRFLKARKKDGFLNVISIYSFIGISLGVAAIIIVMSVMNGFRIDLTNRIIGLNDFEEVSFIEIAQFIEDYAKHMLKQKKASLATIYNYTPLYEVKMYNHKGEK